MSEFSTVAMFVRHPNEDSQGVKDANALEAWFRHKPIGNAFTSALKHAQFTANTILQGMGVKPQVDPALNGMVPGGETIESFRKRVHNPILKAIQSGIQSGTPSLVVTHNSVLKAVNHLVYNKPTSHAVKPGGVLAVQYNGKKFRTMPLLKKDTPANAYE